MNEYVLVTFTVEDYEEDNLRFLLKKKYGITEFFYDIKSHIDYDEFVIFYCRMFAEDASILKLNNGFIGSRASISYISSEIKDRYRG